MIDQETAEVLVREAIELYESIGDPAGLARVRWGLANIEYAKGEGHLQSAYELAELSLEGFRQVGDRYMIGWGTYTVGLAQVTMRRWDDARASLIEALRLFVDTADVSGYTLVLDGLAGLALALGDRQRAARIAGAVDTLERTTGTGLNRTNRAYFGYDPSTLPTDTDTAAAYAVGTALDTQAALAFALGSAEPA